MYVEIAGPPVAVPVTAVKLTVACVLPRTAITPVGASGFAAGVTDPEVAAADVPVEFVAMTLNVYAVPLVNGEIEQVVAGAVTVQVAPPGDAVTT